MKKMVSLMLAACMVLPLGACSSPDKPAETTKAAAVEQNNPAEDKTAAQKVPVEITFMHAENEEERIKVVDALIADFMKEYDHITVDVIPVEEDDMGTKMTTMAQASNLPEVINVSQNNGQFLAINDLVSYDTVASAFEHVGGESVYFDNVLNICRDDNSQLYMLPFNAWVEGVWVNKAMLAEKNMESPQTWDEILEVAKAFHDPANGKYGIALPTQEGAFTQEGLSLFALSNNANVLDAEGNVKVNTPEMKESLEFFKELAQYTMPGSNGTSEVRDAFVSQNAPMAIYSTYIIKRIVDAGFIQDTDLIFPTKQNSACYGYVSGLTVTNQCTAEEQEAAGLLIEYLLRKENVISWMHMAPGGPQPVLTYVSGTEEYLDNETIQAYANLTEAIEEGLDNMQVFGTIGEKTYMKIGDIYNSGAIYKMAYNVVMLGEDIDSEMEKCQKTAESLAN